MLVQFISGFAHRPGQMRLMTLLTMVTGVAMQGLTVVTGALTARSLGVEGRGEFAACTLIPLLLISLGNFGGPVASTYLSARDPSLAPALARNAVLIVLPLSLVLIVVSLVVTSAITNGYGDITLKVLLFSIFAIPAMMLGINLNAINQGTNHLVRFNIARALVPMTYCILMLGLLISHRGSVALALGAWVVSAIVFLAAVSPRLRGVFATDKRIDRATFGLTYRYGIRAHVGSVAPIDSFRLDLALVIAVLTPRDAGLYAVAVGVASIVRSQASTIGLIALPTIARASPESSRIDVARKFFLMTVVAVLGLAGVLSFVASPVVDLVYGRGFHDAVTVTVLLVWAMVIASIRQALGDVLRALGSPGNASISEAISWVVSIPAIFLVQRYGLNGAAFGAILVYAISLIATMLMPTSRGLLRQLLIGSPSHPRGAIREPGRSI